MTAGIAAIICGVLAIITFIRPRVGIALIWPVTWLYPNTLLYDSLPLNVRFDDLFVVLVFLATLASPSTRGQSGRILRLAGLWWLSLAIGAVTGVLITGNYAWVAVLKLIGKSLYVPMTVYVLYAAIQDLPQLERQLRAIAVGAALAGLLAIAMLLQPHSLNIFLIPSYNVEVGLTAQELRETIEDVTTVRAEGAVGVMGLATIMQHATLLCLALMLWHPRPRTRAFYAVLAAVGGVALLYNTTRGAIAGVVVGVIWALFFTRRRVPLVATGVAAGVALILQGSLVQRILRRVTESTGYESGFSQGLAIRLGIWQNFVDNFSPLYLFFGTGMIGAFIEQSMTAHNAYLGALVYTGLFGVVALLLIIWAAVHRVRSMLRIQSDWCAQALGTYLGMVTVAVLVSGLALENLQQTHTMQLFFAAMVFADLRLRQLGGAVAQDVATPLVLPDQPVILPGYASQR